MKKEIKIGLLAFVIIVCSIWLYNFLMGRNLITNNSLFYIEYSDVDQLGKSDPVLINGFKIGTVIDLELEEDLKTVKVTIELNKNIKVPKNSVATIITTGLTGDKAILMEFYAPCSGPDCLVSGDFIQGRTAGVVESMLGVQDIRSSVSDLKGGLAGILDTLSSTLSDTENKNAIGALFQSLSSTSKNLDRATELLERTISSNQKNLTEFVHNLADISKVLSKQSGSIEKLIINAESFTEQLNQMELQKLSGQTKSTMTTMESSLVDLKKTMAEAKTTFAELNTTLDKINTGDGSLSKLLNEEGVYNNIDAATRNLEELLEDMKANPNRYVNFSLFGGKKK